MVYNMSRGDVNMNLEEVYEALDNCELEELCAIEEKIYIKKLEALDLLHLKELYLIRKECREASYQ